MRVHFQVKETIVNIVSDEQYIRVAQDAIFSARDIIESKVAQDQFFQITYEPYPPDSGDDELIRRMSNASVLSGVGPFAGVAGAVAVFAVEKMREAGAKEAIVENGGDIAFLSDRSVPIGLFADHPVLKDVAFKVSSDDITGICSSSAKIGPSVSLGNSNVCTVFSDDVILADCCATALGNLVKDEGSVTDALEQIGSIEGVKGCLACIGDKVAIYGEVPEMVPCADITERLY
ncbi:MAG: UPF0280 family protein [Thermoplasmata archaeon]|nr:UPF0280 family protein [Thermoplasmata archaeon]